MKNYMNPNRYTDTLCQYEIFPHIVCSNPLTPAQKKYCENNKQKFNGKYLCYNHQQRIAVAGSASVVPPSAENK